jgi:hypothetical protein
MSIEDYRATVKEIQNHVKLPHSEFFDMEFSPHREEFLETFTFYTDTLGRNADYGIVPAFMYFNNFTSRNAKAGLLKDTFLLSINMGTVHWLMDNFKLNSNIESSGIRFITVTSKFLDTTPQNLMYQMCFHFTVYHELAHLIQKSPYLESYLDEVPKPNAYSDGRHLLEIDADEYSSLCLGTHILQYAEKLFPTSLNTEILEGLLVLCLVPVFIYMTSFGGGKGEIYFKEKSHPHPIIRVMLVTMTICHYINQSLEVDGKEFSVDYNRVLNRTLQVAHEIEQEVFESPYVDDFIMTLRGNIKGILDYVDYFDNLKNEDNTLAVYKWNRNIEQREEM